MGSEKPRAGCGEHEYPTIAFGQRSCDDEPSLKPEARKPIRLMPRRCVAGPKQLPEMMRAEPAELVHPHQTIKVVLVSLLVRGHSSYRAGYTLSLSLFPPPLRQEQVLRPPARLRRRQLGACAP